MERMLRGLLAGSMLLAMVGIASAASRSVSVASPIKLPMAYSLGVRFAQVFVSHIPDSSVLRTRGFIWNGRPGDNQAYGLYTTFYTPVYRDNDHTHTLAWYKANHPDWIVWECDGVTPFEEFIYSGYQLIELDIGNPDVRAYKLADILNNLGQGYSAVALDNVSIHNHGSDHGGTTSGIRCGHYVGSSWSADGTTRLTGRWVQDYPGTTRDVAWMAASTDYINWLHRKLNEAGYAIAVNGAFTPYDDAQSGLIASIADIWLLENTIQHSCGQNSSDMFLLRLFYQVTAFTKRGGAWIDSDRICEADITLTPNATAAWAIGNFLIMRGDRSYYSAQETGYLTTYPAAWSPNVGFATADAVVVGTLVISGGSCTGTVNCTISGITFQRPYSNGWICVNPSSVSTEPITVPAGNWADQFGNPVAPGPMTLAPNTALVLVKAS